MAKITSDIYDLTKFVDDMKAKHIDAEDTNALYASTFGYMGEVFASILQNSVIMTSEYSNEIIPTRAKFDRNVLIHAKSLGIGKVEAVPATMKVVLCIPESAVLNNMCNANYLGTENTNDFVVDSRYPIMIEGFEFHIIHDIIISRIETPNLGSERKVTYCAQYKTSNDPNNWSTEYLPTVGVIKAINNDNILIVSCTLEQVIYNEIVENIVSDNSITNKTLNFKFDNQLVKFEVEVQEGNNASNPVILTPVYEGLYNDISKYCYYSYINSNSIRIRFDEASYRPRINSKVIIKTWTTNGADANFKYSDDVTCMFTSSNVVSYSNMTITIKQQDEGSVNGINRATVEELQRIIPKERLSRGNVSTLTDLKNYFNSFNVDNAILHVFRKEDNLLTRVYYAYALMKDEIGNIIPTNSIPIEIDKPSTTPLHNRIFIESGTQIQYKRAEGSENYMGHVYTNQNWSTISGDPIDVPSVGTIVDCSADITKGDDNQGQLSFTYMVTQKGSSSAKAMKVVPFEDYRFQQWINSTDIKKFPEELAFDTNIADNTGIVHYELLDGFMYTIPYSISVYDSDLAGDGRPICSYYVDTIKDNYYLGFDYVNDRSDIQFIASNMRINRDSFLSADRYKYTFTLDITPNTGDTSILDPYKMQCFAVFYNEDESIQGYAVGQIDESVLDINVVSTVVRYTFELNTRPLNENGMNESNKIYIDGLYAPGVDEHNQPHKEDKWLTETVKIKIYTLYKYDEPVPDMKKSELTATVTPQFQFSYQDPETEEMMYYRIEDMNVTNVYETLNPVHLFYNYSEKLTSYVSIVQSHLDNSVKYIINRVPVVRLFYFSKQERVDSFVSDIKRMMSYIEMAIDPLETAFGIDMKLFNTCGPSKMYRVTENGRTASLIDRVNLTLNFRTQLFSNTDRSIVDQITNYIKTYIEDIDKLEDLHMPNLISEITQKYRDNLVYFEFLGFDNGYVHWDARYQHIITDESMDMLSMVPEFLNVNFNDISGKPDVNIDVVT